MSDTAAVVLAGGSARRLGGVDKPLLHIGGLSILARIIAAIDVRPIAISANGDPARYASFGLPVLGDSIEDQGPLAGVLAGLDWAAALGATFLLTVPGDTPFIPAGLAAALAPAPSCATTNGRMHHLVALWPTTCRVALRAMLTTPGPRNVVRFTERLGMRSVVFPADGRDPFLNVNTPGDLAAARAALPGGEAEER
jgi:molybdenum cofactor guanylyltransferase